MTVKGDDGIIVAFDTISYDLSGTVLSTTACKVLPLMELNCAIGNVGAAGFTTALRDKIAAKYIDFDDLLTGLVEDFRDVHDDMIEMYCQQPGPSPNATVMLAGWSDQRNTFETYRISTREKDVVIAGEQSVTPAFALVPTEGCWVSSAYRAEDMERFGIDIENETNLLNLAVRIVCACRAAGAAEGTGDFQGVPYAVGGQLQILLLERGRITQWVTHRWPDEAGKPVDPTAGEALPPWLTQGPLDRLASDDGGTGLHQVLEQDARRSNSIPEGRSGL
ncbi:hypothetical protein Q2941_46485 [Bradyrhizobium sp. UFLA05-153]